MAAATTAAEADISRSTKTLPDHDPHSSRIPCKGRRVLRNVQGDPVTDSAGAFVTEAAWCDFKPCKPSFHCKEPVCMLEGRRVDNHHLECKVLCKANSAAKA